MIQSLLAPVPMEKSVKENIKLKIQGCESLQKLRDDRIEYLHPWHAVEFSIYFRVTLLAATVKITDLKGDFWDLKASGVSTESRSTSLV